jgi:hypothetical protein
MNPSGVSRREFGMKQRNVIVIGVMLGALVTGMYSWYTGPGTSGEALASAPLPATPRVPSAFESLAPAVLPEAPVGSPPPAETPSITADPPAETVTPVAPAERDIAPAERPGSPPRNSGRRGSKRED